MKKLWVILGVVVLAAGAYALRGGPPVVVAPGRAWVYDAKLEIKEGPVTRPADCGCAHCLKG